jgi:phosphate transport system protein
MERNRTIDGGMVFEHTIREYERELRTVRDRLLEMGGRAEEQVALALKAMVERNDAVAQTVIAADARVDEEELEIDDLCLRILARRQPMASDLRFVASALKIVTDVERVGDLAVNIAKRVLDLDSRPPLNPPVDIPRLAEVVRAQLHDALDAFVRGDVDLANSVLGKDAQVDTLNAELIRQLVDSMVRDPVQVPQGLSQISVSRYLERVGDHATNIAEMVVFLVQGRDIRHHHKISRPRT